MKRSVFCSMVIGGIMFTAVNCQATVPENTVYEIHPDTHIETVYKYIDSYQNDGYLEYMTTPSKTQIYASNKDHMIKQVTNTYVGTRIDAAVCGSSFDPSKMTCKEIANWVHGNYHYYTYNLPTGEVFMVTVEKGIVVALTEYSKTLSNC